jgi:hypothetical protein
MKLIRLLVLAGAAVTLTLVSACTETTSGSPGTSGTSASTQTSGPSSAPKVANPLPDVASYTDKPCDLVPAALVTQLGYSDPEPSDANGALGPGCGWIDVRTAHGKNFNVAIGILNGKGNGGIAKVYSLNGSLFSFVEPTSDVSGYPAVYADTTDRRTQGKCALIVGVTDDVTFSVDTDGYSGAQDSCDTAKQIAAAVITKLQGGS